MAENVTYDADEALHFGSLTVDAKEMAHFVIMVICSVLSVIGTVFMFILMSSPKYCNKSFSVYLRCVVISDVVYSVFFTLYKGDSVVSKYMGRRILFIDSITPLCIVITDLQNVMQTFSAWFLLALSVDRFAAVVYPLKQPIWCTKRRAIITCIVLFLLITAIQVAINVKKDMVQIRIDSCFGVEVAYYSYLILKWNTALVFFIPYGLILIINSKIIITIMHSHKMLGDSSTQDQSKVIRATISLAVVCIISVITMLPISAYYILIFFDGSYATYTIYYTVNVFRMANFSSNFYIIILSGKQYRLDLGKILSGQKLRE